MSVPEAAASGHPPRTCVYQHRKIDPVELPAIMRKHIYTGVMGTVYYAIIGGVFFVAYWQQLGGTPMLWSLLTAFVQISVTGQLLSAYLTGRTGARKKLWYRAELFSRILRLASVAAAAVLLPYSHVAACWALIVCVMAASFFQSLASPPWQSWLSSIIPADRHGWFMGRRGVWVALGTMAVVLPAGWLLDAVPAAWKLPFLLGIFGAGIVVGVVDLVIHRTIPEPAVPVDRMAGFWSSLLRPMADRRFRPYLIFQGVWTFSVLFGAVMTWPFWTNVLQLDKSMIGMAILIVGAPLAIVILTGKRIGVLVDRIGARPVLWGGSLIWAAIPGLWLIATPANVWPILCAWATMNSLGCNAALQAASKIQTRSAPPEHTASYVAVSTFIAAIAAAVGALSGGWVFSHLERMSLQVGPWTWGPYEVVFAASVVLRFGSTTLISGVQEPALAEVFVPVAEAAPAVAVKAVPVAEPTHLPEPAAASVARRSVA